MIDIAYAMAPQGQGGDAGSMFQALIPMVLKQRCAGTEEGAQHGLRFSIIAQERISNLKLFQEYIQPK